MNVSKEVKAGYKVLTKPVSKVEIKARLTDVNNTPYYVYDLFNENGVCMALNRYVLTDNRAEQPFSALTQEEEDILNPPYVEPEEGEMI